MSNTGTAPVALSDITLRYWYTRDGAQSQTYRCIFARRGCTYVTGTIGALGSPACTADSYVELGFKPGAGSLTEGARSIGLDSQITRGDGSSYDETNDYSYDPTKTAFADWSNITLCRNGVLVWGTEP